MLDIRLLDIGADHVLDRFLTLGMKLGSVDICAIYGDFLRTLLVVDHLEDPDAVSISIGNGTFQGAGAYGQRRNTLSLLAFESVVGSKEVEIRVEGSAVRVGVDRFFDPWLIVGSPRRVVCSDRRYVLNIQAVYTSKSLTLIHLSSTAPLNRDPEHRKTQPVRLAYALRELRPIGADSSPWVAGGFSGSFLFEPFDVFKGEPLRVSVDLAGLDEPAEVSVPVVSTRLDL